MSDRLDDRLAPPPDAVPLLMPARHAAVLAAIGVATGQRLRRPGRRRPARSQAEYEDRWARQRAARRWAAAPTLTAALSLSSYGSRRLVAQIDFGVYRVPAPSFFRWRADQVARLFTRRYVRSTPIAEIGCGMGKNLLILAHAGFQDLAGYDPSASARRAVVDQADHFGLDLAVDHLDLLDPPGGLAHRLAGHVLFTNHVLEQLPRDLPTAVDTLVAARPAEVLHLEPCPELLRPTRRIVDLGSLAHTWARDYQHGLLRHLTHRARAGQIELIEVRRLGYSPGLVNDPTLIRWRTKATSAA